MIFLLYPCVRAPASGEAAIEMDYARAQPFGGFPDPVESGFVFHIRQADQNASHPCLLILSEQFGGIDRFKIVIGRCNPRTVAGRHQN